MSEAKEQMTKTGKINSGYSHLAVGSKVKIRLEATPPAG
jgi:hypothetical protein